MQLMSKITIIFSIITLFGINSNGATLCNQEFTIYGKTSGEHSLLFWDLYVGGECYYWVVHSLALGYEKPYQMTLRIDEGGKDWIPSLMKDLPMEPMTYLYDSAGLYYLNDSAYFTSPPDDTTFLDNWLYWNKIGRIYDLSGWERECPINCIDYPVFHGIKADLVYEFRGGLYKNYSFKQVIYFPESNYLVLITNQPILAAGLDTMHGMLVYKLSI